MKYRIVTKSDKFFSPVAPRDDCAVQRRAYFIWFNLDTGLTSQYLSMCDVLE